MTQASDSNDNAPAISKENKVVKVNRMGGIVGALGDSPAHALTRRIEEENAQGWSVRQVLEDTTDNLFLTLIRTAILVFTVFLYTPANGYLVILERDV